jgi:PHP family Zn ribbon phosphoesterase
MTAKKPPPGFRKRYVRLPVIGECELVDCVLCNGTGVPLPPSTLSKCPDCGGYGKKVHSRVTALRLSMEDAAKLLGELRPPPGHAA